MKIEKKYICNRCKKHLDDDYPEMKKEAMIGLQVIKNEKQPMWKKLLLGNKLRKILLCRDCFRDFDNKMIDFMF